MKNSNSSLRTSLLRKGLFPKNLLAFFLALAFFGFLDASYLTLAHERGGGVVCGVTSACNTVLQSPYAEFAGVPVAAAGVAYYLVLVLLLYASLMFRSVRAQWASAALSGFGALASLGFLYLQAFVIRAFCPYCLISAAISLTISLTFAWFIYADR